MPDLRIYPDRELLVKPRVCQDAITIGAFIDECYSLLATNHRFALEVFRSPMNHKALREYAKEHYRRMLDVDHSIDLLKRRSSPPYTMGGIAPFIKERLINPIQEVF